MFFITPPAVNQLTLPFTFVIPALSLTPLLALLILVMKRKRSPTPTDPEAQISFAGDTLFKETNSAKESLSITTSENQPSTNQIHAAKVPRTQSQPRKKRARKAIPQRMLHMKKHMTVWGDRWLPSNQPSTAGSQQGEINPSGIYTVSRSPPPAYRTTSLPLSPVVMASNSSSPNLQPLSSDFKLVDDCIPPPLTSQTSPSFDEMFLFGDSFGLGGGGEIFGQLSKADPRLSYCTFEEDPLSAFNADAPSFSLSHPSYNAPRDEDVSFFRPPSSFTSPLPIAFSNSIPMDFHSGTPFVNIPSSFNGSHAAYPVHGANSFSDWIPPPVEQHGLPLDNVAHFADDLTYNHSLAFSSPSQNPSNFSAAAWKGKARHTQYSGEVGQMIPLVAGYSTPPMYTGHGSPYLAMSDGSYSPVYQRSGSGSPVALYSGQSPQYYPHAPHSPLSTRATSSGSGASLYSMNNPSPHTRSSNSMPFLSEYGDSFDYNYSSPHSAVFTGSPSSVSESVYGGLELGPITQPPTLPEPFRFHSIIHPPNALPTGCRPFSAS
ncbi:hypothetical protein C8R44DRAFT_71415 [Mycena epipterygia]|nr:hypothetical protein C8R44DRAFT_71415 [Mycena epipterygia]